MARRSRDRDLPTEDDIAEFIRDSDAPLSKREIARGLAIGAHGRHDLNKLLEVLERDGRIARTGDRRYRAGAKLPHVAVLEITGTDDDGELLARPVSWREEIEPPTIYVMTERRRGAQPGPGDRVLARIDPLEAGTYEARVMRRLEAPPGRVLGRFETTAEGGRVRPANRRIKTYFAVAGGDSGDAEDGDIVLCDVIDGRSRGLPLVRVTERLGEADAPGSATVLAIHGNEIPVNFAPAALDTAAAAEPAPMTGRADLRELPLITIDDEDARDFDDAVWAESDPDNRGGWHLVVAIADVAWYVHPAGALDIAAHERGNSVYFPDQVVPMLPETLSNGLCSLKPDEDRPCLAVHMWIDGKGRHQRHLFERAMMRSAARLTYQTVQSVRDGILPADTVPGAVDIDALYGAYQALLAARSERGTIELELPERRIRIDAHGAVRGIEIRPRHDSHRLIEEFMIAANVCAADTLAASTRPAMYRVHDEPPPDRLTSLREFLKSLGYRLAGGQAVRPRHFTGILQRVAGTEHAAAINQAILRSQSQAVYSPENVGHFGLALRRYSHFTSPIRRYADLLVHRALIAALDLGDGGLDGDTTEDDFAELGQHLSMTERRATAAEREAVERMAAAFLAERVGASFAARITGVERFGLFVALDDTGAEGLVPASALGGDNFRFDRTRHVLEGRHSRESFVLGQAIEVRLEEANPITGGLVFSLPDRAAVDRSRRNQFGRRQGGKSGKGRRKRR